MHDVKQCRKKICVTSNRNKQERRIANNAKAPFRNRFQNGTFDICVKVSFIVSASYFFSISARPRKKCPFVMASIPSSTWLFMAPLIFIPESEQSAEEDIIMRKAGSP